MPLNFSFLIAFISSIGFCRLFLSINRQVSRRRTIAILIICILKTPLILLCKDVFLEHLIFPVYISILIMIYESLCLLTVVLLSTDRRLALVCAAFMFSLMNTLEFPIVLLIGAITQPSLNILQYFEEIFQNHTIYLVYMFFINFVFLCYCFLAARWISKTQTNPTRSLTAFVSLIFIIIAVITFIWARDIITIASISYWAAAFLSLLLAVLPLIIFYLYIRLMTGREIIIPNEKDVPYYTEFIQKLSKRELNVIEAVLEGYVSQKDLASKLNISVNTVKTHLKHIYQTTGVSSVDALLLLFQGYTQNHPRITPKSPKRWFFGNLLPCII